MAQYANIPGVNMNVLDGQMLLGQDNSVNSVLIIADVNAPSRVEVPEEPTLVRNEEELKEQFGGFFHRGLVNPIAAEWASVYRQGLRNIYLLALNGADKKEQFMNLRETLLETMADLSIEHVVLAGLHADEDIAVNVEELDGLEGINTHYVRRGTEAVSTEVEGLDLSLTLMAGNIELNADIDEGTPAQMVAALNAAIKGAIAESNADIDVTFELDGNTVVMKSSVDVQAVDSEDMLTALKLRGLEDGMVEATMESYANPGSLLGAYAERQNREIGETLCYIGVKPPESTSLGHIRAWHEALIARRNEVHAAVQIVAGPEVGVTLPGSLRTQWVSGATQYALLVQGLPAQIAPTNQVLPQAQNLKMNLSMTQINRLAGNKYVTFRMKNSAITVVDAITSAPDIYVGQDVVRSDFTRLSTLRSVNYITRRLRNALDAYIGQPNEFAVYNSMRTTVKSEIRDAIDNLIIQDASFSIQMGDTFDSAEVKLTILPQFELRRIDVTIGLTTPERFEGGQD